MSSPVIGKRVYPSLAAAALILGALAAFAGSPVAASNARIDVPSLASTVDRDDDHVAAVELAGWIKDGRQNLRIVDLRDSAEFEDYHIPRAERIAIGDLTKTPFRKDETIVLYSDGAARAAQGWVFLRALGFSHVYYLRGGLYEWLDDVMNPTISPTANDSVRGEFKKVAEISRYFGGVPRVGDSPSARAAGKGQKGVNAVSRLRGRGC